MCVCVCVHESSCVCASTCLTVCLRACVFFLPPPCLPALPCVRESACKCVFVCDHAHVSVCMRLLVCVHVWIPMSVSVCVCVCVRVCGQWRVFQADPVTQNTERHEDNRKQETRCNRKTRHVSATPSCITKPNREHSFISCCEDMWRRYTLLHVPVWAQRYPITETSAMGEMILSFQ